MKEKISTVIILFAFLLFCLFTYFTNSRNEILEVKTPTIMAVDLNNNNVIDNGETICIPNVTSYTANLFLYRDEVEGVNFSKGIALGYLADDFAQKTLAGKLVKLKFTGENTPQCRFAEIYTENGKYSDVLKSSGFGIVNGKFADNDKASENLRAAEDLKLVIFNHKSEKVHTLDCKYGQAARDAVVLERKDVPLTSSKCKFCHIQPNIKIEKPNLKPVPNIMSDGNIKFILTDFTQILKPDKNCNHAVCKELVKLIDSAKNSIDIALYGWTDIPKLKYAMENAEKRGVNVRIVYDTKTNSTNYYPDTESFVKRFAHTRSDYIEGNSKLTNFLMHNKFMVFDNKTVYTGSMNFSLTGLSGFNQNNVVIINSPQAAKIYSQEFENLYNGKFHTLKLPNKINKITLSDGSVITIYFSPQDKGMTKGVIPLIQNSKKYIYIPAFLITHKNLASALISAKQRGVDVRIILDATSVGARNSALKTLRTGGIPVKIENYAGKMHSKSMIIDDKYVVSGSANFSNSGENKNDENQIIIENPKLAKFYKDFFNYLWAKIPDKYLKVNPRPESKESIGSCSDGVDNDYDGKIDKDDEGCR